MASTPAPLLDSHHRRWASLATLLAILAASAVCLSLMNRFHVTDGSPLDVTLFMSRAESMVTVAAWSASGSQRTITFYLLDCVWAVLWNSFFYFLFHRALRGRGRRALEPLRSAVAFLLMGVCALDYLENASIVSLAMRYPDISSLHYGASRVLTHVKWLGIATFFLVLVVGSLWPNKRGPNDHA